MVLKKRILRDVKEYLKLLQSFSNNPDGVWSYNNIADFLLKEGKPMLGLSKTLKGHYGKGFCYRTAFEIASSYGYGYVEGYALCEGLIPLEHAWNVDNEGNVIDGSWEDGVAYYGVEIPYWYVCKILFATKRHGILDTWDIGWPLISGKHGWPLERAQVAKVGIK